MLQSLCKQQTGDLCHCFYDKYAGHNRRTGEMPLEELLVEADVLYAFDSCVSFDFDYLVHEQERISVRQYLGNLPNIQKGIGTEFGHAFLLLCGLV